jgi:hypothetical protein
MITVYVGTSGNFSENRIRPMGECLCTLGFFENYKYSAHFGLFFRNSQAENKWLNFQTKSPVRICLLNYLQNHDINMAWFQLIRLSDPRRDSVQDYATLKKAV